MLDTEVNLMQSNLTKHEHYYAAHLNHWMEIYSRQNYSLLKAFMVVGILCFLLFALDRYHLCSIIICGEIGFLCSSLSMSCIYFKTFDAFVWRTFDRRLFQDISISLLNEFMCIC